MTSGICRLMQTAVTVSAATGTEKSITASGWTFAQAVDQRHAERVEPGQRARVLAQLRVRRRIDRRDDAELRIGRAQRHQAAAHPAGRAMNCNGNNRHS